jgi:PEP-CTERM motif
VNGSKSIIGGTAARTLPDRNSGMRKTRFNDVLLIAAGLSVFLSVIPARATLITDLDSGLTLDTDPATLFGQIAASPCVIGGNNCLNGGFPMELAGAGGAGSTFDVTNSFFYTVGQISTVVGGNAFTMGLDYNQSNVAQTLNLFEALYYTDDDDAAFLSSQVFDVVTVLPVNHNGAGFSDFLLSGFVIPGSATHVKFHANWFNNSGADRYFLIGADAVAIPEPSTWLLTATGLAGLFYRGRRRHARRVDADATKTTASA